MLTLPGTVRIWMAAEAVDLRRGFDGLAALVREVIGQEPLSGHLFCFRNKRGDRLKILFFAAGGFCLYYKRLERGTFFWPRDPGPSRHWELDGGELTLLLEGIDLRGARRRPRWEPAVRQLAR